MRDAFIIFFMACGFISFIATMLFLFDNDKIKAVSALYVVILSWLGIHYGIHNVISQPFMYVISYIICTIIISPFFDIFMLGRKSFDDIPKMWEVKRLWNNEPVITSNYRKYELCVLAPFRIPYCIVIGLYNGITIGFGVPKFIDKFLDNLAVKKVEKSHKNK